MLSAVNILSTCCGSWLWSFVNITALLLQMLVLQLSREVVDNLSFDELHAFVQAKGFERLPKAKDNEESLQKEVEEQQYNEGGTGAMPMFRILLVVTCCVRQPPVWIHKSAGWVYRKSSWSPWPQ